jgi:transcriptional regulator with XRE-family HTH domain
MPARKIDPLFEELRAARKELGLSQSEAARLAGIGRGVISLGEQGNRSSRFGLVQQWARALGKELTLNERKP